jgi:hypothetical protein
MHSTRRTPILFLLVSLCGGLFGYGSYETLRALHVLNIPTFEAEIQTPFTHAIFYEPVKPEPLYI